MKLVVGLLLIVLYSVCPALEDEAISYPARAQVPKGYAASYEKIIRAAENEGKLVIYSTTDIEVAKPLIADFRAMYPRIELSFEDLSSTELHHRYIAETQLGSDSADVLWSSAMDQQTSLVGKGYAATYESPESASLPDWAKWRGQAFATTFEPVVIAYNKTLLPEDAVPRTHADLIRLLVSDPTRFKGKLVTYNIEKSGVGFFLATQDVGASPAFWDLAQALGKLDMRLVSTTDAMLQQVVSGKAIIAYNALGAYTIAQARKTPAIGYVFPSDYTLVMSRVLFISRKAANPNAARLWVDYLLSKRGQSVLANQSGLYAVRGDVEGESTATRLTQVLGAGARPIAIGPGLAGHLDNPKYRDFIRQWRKATGNP